MRSLRQTFKPQLELYMKFILPMPIMWLHGARAAALTSKTARCSARLTTGQKEIGKSTIGHFTINAAIYDPQKNNQGSRQREHLTTSRYD